MKKITLCIKSKVIDINLLHDLKNSFDVVYEDSRVIDYILEDDTFIWKEKNIEFNLSHWFELFVDNNLEYKFCDLFLDLLVGFKELHEEII